MDSSKILSELKHFKDIKFSFNPELHAYTYLNQPLISVTQFQDRFFTSFDSQVVAERVSAKTGEPVSEILEKWNIKGQNAANDGTIIHDWIENFLKGKNKPLPEDQKTKHRISNWLKLYEKKLIQLQPIAQELKVWNLDWKLAGTIDALFLWNDKLIVGDWKTNEKLTTDSDRSYQNLLYPFQHLADNKLNRYSIQLSLYRLILEARGLVTGTGFICWIDHEGNVELFKVKDLRNELKSYLETLV